MCARVNSFSHVRDPKYACDNVIDNAPLSTLNEIIITIFPQTSSKNLFHSSPAHEKSKEKRSFEWNGMRKKYDKR